MGGVFTKKRCGSVVCTSKEAKKFSADNLRCSHRQERKCIFCFFIGHTDRVRWISRSLYSHPNMIVMLTYSAGMFER